MFESVAKTAPTQYNTDPAAPAMSLNPSVTVKNRSEGNREIEVFIEGCVWLDGGGWVWGDKSGVELLAWGFEQPTKTIKAARQI